jgi:hypothetical protein
MKPISMPGFRVFNVQDVASGWQVFHGPETEADSPCFFEAFIMMLAPAMAVSKIAEVVSEHEFASVFVDLDQSKVIYATEGKDSSTVESFKTDLCEHQGDPDKVEDNLLRYVTGLYQRRREVLSQRRYHL